MSKNCGSDFIRSAPLRVGTRNFVSVLGAILPAILISVVAARVVIFRYACVAVIVCKNAGAALLASIVLLLPANLLPISIIYLNGGRQEDTILSGIMSLASSNIAVAGIVFIASILVPFTKVIVMFTLLLSIHFKCQQGLRTRILLLRMVTWIGRWSMLDLFVISLTMSLINRDQILAFTMGPAAFYFGAAVILTILAVEWLDSRLLWDAHESGNARFDD